MPNTLVEILRPRTLDDIVGQGHLLGPDAPLRRLAESNNLPNIILYGPPGTGKSSIANILAETTQTRFVKLNATSFTVKELRKHLGDDPVTIYIDEIYRLSSNQADVLLPYTENSLVTLIGATTENPFHSLKAALISRSHIFELYPLKPRDIASLIVRAAQHGGHLDIRIEQDASRYIIKVACGDGRKAISIVDLAARISGGSLITLDLVQSIAPNKYHTYSRDKHYDWASAIQGAIQVSDPDAAIYFLAQALESGEDPRYIGRRVLVSAAEDASSDPMATSVAHAAYTAAKEIGRPECDLLLAQAVIIIATSPRDKSSAIAIWDAIKDVKEGHDIEVPKEMRDSHYEGAKLLGNGGFGDGSNPDSYIGVSKKYYKPLNNIV